MVQWCSGGVLECWDSLDGVVPKNRGSRREEGPFKSDLVGKWENGTRVFSHSLACPLSHLQLREQEMSLLTSAATILPAFLALQTKACALRIWLFRAGRCP